MSGEGVFVPRAGGQKERRDANRDLVPCEPLSAMADEPDGLPTLFLNGAVQGSKKLTSIKRCRNEGRGGVGALSRF